MNDTIYRQQAIDEVINLWADKPFGNPTLVEIKDCIEALPSAQPRKTGKWIKLYAGNYKCSVCGDWWGNDNNEMVEDFKYCPNCGARMEGDDNETDRCRCV